MLSLKHQWSQWQMLAVVSVVVTTLAARAEPPASPQAGSETIKPLARIGKETTGFTVTCFALAPQGDVVAVGSDDGKIRLWKLAESKVVRTFEVTQNGYISSIAFSPDARRIAFHADDHPVRFWDVELGAEVSRSREEFSLIQQIRFSPDGKLIGLVDDDSTAYLWSLPSGKIKKLNQPASTLAFSPDGKTLALGFNTLRLVEVASGSTTQEFGKLDGRVTCLAFSPAGTDLLVVDSGCPGTTVRLLAIDSEDEIVFGEKIRYERVGAGFSADGKIVAINDGVAAAAFWDVETGRKLLSLPGFHRDANSVVFTPDNQRLLSGRNDSYSSDLLVWDAAEILQLLPKKLQ